MRSTALLHLVALAALVSGCASTTTVDLHAFGLDGATASDEHGTLAVVEGDRASFPTRRLRLRQSWSAAPLDVVDEETGRPFVLRVERGGERVELAPFCLPGGEVDRPIDQLTLLLRRDVATGECALIALETVQGGRLQTGEYTPERFDDGPCGPWQ